MKLQGLKPDAGLYGKWYRAYGVVAIQIELISYIYGGISIDMKTFDTLVKCICNKEEMHKAYRIVDEMVLDGCAPDEGIWLSSIVLGSELLVQLHGNWVFD
ncbi:PREDICTED: pentatricopeptide [Prunus dulcis]|uniref:PREDICTED: pentatricopeptide n=1 Tax=Prunus dulcis TaxID=3755 RepID=A0A5E4EG75_PRUDU|nr:hypothetical protein L3X38_035191 [Prunus dulcis]VVA14452.1 PREDICTED: pentatricopeptide [Prunus dulcis]